MAKRRSTIRKMHAYPVAWKYNHLVAELVSITRRLNVFAAEVERLEFDRRAFEEGLKQRGPESEE